MGSKWADIQLEEGDPSAHAVEIVGWDKDTKYGPYWIVKNTWGKEWNEDGFFKYAMYPNNKYLALDVPITNAIQPSTGSVIKNEGQSSGSDVENLFGSCMSFEPLHLLSDDSNYLNYNDDVEPINEKNNTSYVILTIIFIIFFIGFLFIK